MFNKTLDQGQAGDNVGCLLRGVKREEIERGQVLAKPGSITPHTKFEAEVYVPVEGRRRPAHAVFQRLSPAVLLPHDGRDRHGQLAGRRRNVHARRQRADRRSSCTSRSPWTKAFASPSAKAARRSARAS